MGQTEVATISDKIIEHLLPVGKLRVALGHGKFGKFGCSARRNDMHGLVHAVMPVSPNRARGLYMVVGDPIFFQGSGNAQADGAGTDHEKLRGATHRGLTLFRPRACRATAPDSAAA